LGLDSKSKDGEQNKPTQPKADAKYVQLSESAASFEDQGWHREIALVFPNARCVPK
jgi:hypothetical protein